MKMKRIFGLSLCLLTVFLLGACSSDDTLVFVNSKEDGEIEWLYEELSQ